MAGPRTTPGTTTPREERFRRAPDARARDPLGPRADAAPPPTWRDDVLTASGLNLLAGIWLIIAPFVLGYSSGDPYWNDIVFGAIVALLALVKIGGAYRASALSWVNAVIGAWLFASAFWLDQSSTAAWNDIILGIIVFLLGVSSAAASRSATTTAAGRRR